MVLCHAMGAVCTAVLAVVLLGSPDGTHLPLIGVLAIQGVAAIAEAMLVVRLSSLIPLLISNRERLQRANGLFATMDGLVITMAPFLGGWLVASQGLEGVLLVDGVSFLLALLSVLVAPWAQAFESLDWAVLTGSNTRITPRAWKRLRALAAFQPSAIRSFLLR